MTCCVGPAREWPGSHTSQTAAGDTSARPASTDPRKTDSPAPPALKHSLSFFQTNITTRESSPSRCTARRRGVAVSGRGGWRTYKRTWMWTPTTASTLTWSAPTSAARASRGSSCPHTWQTPAPTETSSATTATSPPPTALSATTTGQSVPASPCRAPTAARSGPWSEPTWRTTSKCACCRRWRVG